MSRPDLFTFIFTAVSLRHPRLPQMILSARPQTNVCLKPARLLKAEVEKKDADEGQDDDGDDDDGGGDDD